jgi:hypothetical protein
MYYVLATVEGLHLTCDFVVYSAALYGCSPDYTPTPTGLHEMYRQPYEHLGVIPFKDYVLFSSISAMDDLTLQAIASLQNRSIKDFTCLAFEVNLRDQDITSIGSPDNNSKFLQQLLEQGERIIDVIRLFLFKPGDNTSIGRVGGLGNGVCGIWVGDDGEYAKFLARQVSSYQFVQKPMQVTLANVRKIYNDPVFKELCSAACDTLDNFDPLLKRIFQGLCAFRESRDIQNLEARFLRLASLAEHLAKKDSTEYLKGSKLRTRIAQIAQFGWNEKTDVLSITTQLWDHVRNPLTHSVETFASIGRDPEQDIPNMERIVIDMLQAIVIAWRDEQFGIDPYTALLSQ